MLERLKNKVNKMTAPVFCENERFWNFGVNSIFICLYIVYQIDEKVLIMTKQEVFAELKDLVRCAGWVDEDYVGCVSTEALKVVIEALERDISTDPDRV